MPFVQDEELLQDFLVEAGELLEQLSEQLVELEHDAHDSELLNAIFRAFHTIKGGAGFLEIKTLVDVCHRAEDVFDALRQGRRDVDAHLMDVILRAYDNLLEQMNEIRGGNEPEPVDEALISQLEQLLSDESPSASAEQPEIASETVDVVSETETVEETVAIVEEESIEVPAAEPVVAAGGNEISDDEFEALLNDLHGGGIPGAVKVERSNEAETVQLDAPAEDSSVSWSLISEPEAVEPKVVASAPVKVREARPAVTESASAAQAAAAKKTRDAGNAAASEATVRVDTRRLDDIMNLVGELVLVRNRLQTLRTGSTDEAIGHAVDNLNLVTSDLQASVMKTRMQPVKKIFGRFPKVVRDLSRSLGKEVRLEMLGEETDLDKNLVEALADPLVHLVRNALDHGIEMPDAREKKGKPRCGVLRLSAQQEGDHILLVIEDDGGGMDADRLKNLAVERGLLDRDTADRLSDHDAYQLIFAAGFSTKEQISDISGRGVGMDVVKTKINQLNGRLDVVSELGVGTKILISLPLTLAIMPTLMVVVSGQVFALPLGSIVETTNLTQIITVDGQEVIMVRQHPLPIIRLQHWLTGKRCDPPHGGHVVIVNLGTLRVGLVVDHMLGQEEVVIKPLGAGLHGLKGVAGATITGNGKVSLILDIPGLVQKYAVNM
ncbi:MAG: chemotaxis protein CheA [Gammaproteobacteria bacterium]|nr:chemotaxis protein CheA [Gammaproteobacteria bacterium]